METPKKHTAPNRMPAPPAVLATLTGAAKRSADAAMKTARVWYADLQAKEQAMLDAIDPGVPVNATNLAIAIRACNAVDSMDESTLAASWRNEIGRAHV